ncbi:MAG: FkbM family methyltransferase [Colwellia sp.]|jgi:FkbM family methyltransferase
MLMRLLEFILSKRPITKLTDIGKGLFDGYSLKSYSQEGEDMILRRLFENQLMGFYVDVGAHHPKRFSNTYFFYKKGWRGINIDAMPNSMRLFKKVRPRDINIEKPVSDKKQILTYYIFNEPALNGFSKELSGKRNGQGGYFVERTENIETTTLEDILNCNLPINQPIDFLSIDVEGLDFKVLKSNNFDIYRPKVILIEILKSCLEDVLKSEVAVYLTKENYCLYAKSVNTVVFIEPIFYKERFGE